MTFVQAIQSGFKNYVKFQGRATRSEFWWWMLFYMIIVAVLDSMAMGELQRGTPGLFTGVLGLVGLVFLLPTLGLMVRRLHDTGRSGWWVLIDFVPLVGIILLIVWWASKGTLGPNKYGVGDTVTQAANTFN